MNPTSTSARPTPSKSCAIFAPTGLSDTEFVRGLRHQYNVTILPDSFIDKETVMHELQSIIDQAWEDRSKTSINELLRD